MGYGNFIVEQWLQEVTVEVAESTVEPPERCQAGGAPPTTPPTKLRRFISRFSAGLRVRASPSLQAEELGRIPAGANIAFVEEVSLTCNIYTNFYNVSYGMY